ATPTPTPTPSSQAAPVTFSTSGGGRGSLSVSMSTATSGATIFYTNSSSGYVTPTHNGGTPTGSTLIYSGPITVPAGSHKFFEAVAYKSGMTDSAFSTFSN